MCTLCLLHACRGRMGGAKNRKINLWKVITPQNCTFGGVEIINGDITLSKFIKKRAGTWNCEKKKNKISRVETKRLSLCNTWKQIVALISRNTDDPGLSWNYSRGHCLESEHFFFSPTRRPLWQYFPFAALSLLEKFTQSTPLFFSQPFHVG